MIAARVMAGKERRAKLVLLGVHVEMVVPELGHHFANLRLGVNGADQRGGKGVEGALSFESINVIFTGKSNLTAKTCFKTFQYKVTDVKYGVKFKYLGYARSDNPSNEEYFIINFEEWNSTESQNNP